MVNHGVVGQERSTWSPRAVDGDVFFVNGDRRRRSDRPDTRSSAPPPTAGRPRSGDWRGGDDTPPAGHHREDAPAQVRMLRRYRSRGLRAPPCPDRVRRIGRALAYHIRSFGQAALVEQLHPLACPSNRLDHSDPHAQLSCEPMEGNVCDLDTHPPASCYIERQPPSLNVSRLPHLLPLLALRSGAVARRSTPQHNTRTLATQPPTSRLVSMWQQGFVLFGDH